jgi:hypothetical protein
MYLDDPPLPFFIDIFCLDMRDDGVFTSNEKHTRPFQAYNKSLEDES